MSETKSFIARMSEAAAAMDRVAKDGKNSFHRYDYVTHDDVSALVRKELFPRGIAMTVRIDDHTWEDGTSSKNKPQRIHSVRGRLLFHDSESEKVLESDFIGQSMDREDKGLSKALSSGVKTALMKTFLIPSGDPEEDTEHDKNQQEPFQPDKPRNQQRLSQERPPQRAREDKTWAQLSKKQQAFFGARFRELASQIEWEPKYEDVYEWASAQKVLPVCPDKGRTSITAATKSQIERCLRALESIIQRAEGGEQS